MEFIQKIFIDTSRTFVYSTPQVSSDSMRTMYRMFEYDLRRAKSLDLKKYFYVAFRYRDRKLVPLYFSIFDFYKTNPILRLWAISVIGSTADAGDFDTLAVMFRNEKNDVTREYIANALGKTGDSRKIPVVTELLAEEKNAYVRKTLESSLKRMKSKNKYKNKFTYLPGFEKGSFNKLKYFFNAKVLSGDTMWTDLKSTDSSVDRPENKKLVFPHQQYRDGIRHSPPLNNFGNRNQRSFHVGEDSGWMLEGLPVHSIGRGRVVLIHHDLSWGCLVAVEYKIKKEILTAYYAHLSYDLDVDPGQMLETGEKIGEIGPGATFQNGGYWPHLHLGIEKADFSSALFHGYSSDTTRWYNPVTLINSYR